MNVIDECVETLLEATKLDDKEKMRECFQLSLYSLMSAVAEKATEEEKQRNDKLPCTVEVHDKEKDMCMIVKMGRFSIEDLKEICKEYKNLNTDKYNLGVFFDDENMNTLIDKDYNMFEELENVFNK